MGMERQVFPVAYDIIILGSGPAGLAAAVAARGRDKSVLVIGNRWQDSPGGACR